MQIDIGRGNQSEIHMTGCFPADLGHHAVFENPQQMRLDR